MTKKMVVKTQQEGLCDISDFVTREQAASRLKRDIEALYPADSEAYKVMHAQLDWLLGMCLMQERMNLANDIEASRLTELQVENKMEG